MHTIKIILVDDHKLFLDGLSVILEKEEHIEILATFLDANTALERIKLYAPALLITDISMPNMNGVEFIEKVKKRFPSLKILVASSFKQMISHKLINGHILKDDSSEEFIKAIKEIVVNRGSYFNNDFNKPLEILNKSYLTKERKK